jgi:hypothetical protein
MVLASLYALRLHSRVEALSVISWRSLRVIDREIDQQKSGMHCTKIDWISYETKHTLKKLD